MENKGILFYYSKNEYDTSSEKVPVDVINDKMCSKFLNEEYRNSTITIIDTDGARKQVNPFYMYNVKYKTLYLMYQNTIYLVKEGRKHNS